MISRYVMSAVLPYFFFIWILLSVVLFVQQGGRYSDLIFNTNLPGVLLWQLTFALIPNVIAFTGPIALLVGVVIGLSRMQGDSEMTAIRAAGVGNLQIVFPAAILGVLLSLFALFINLKGVPFAAQVVRQVALKAAIYKLQSPVDPGVFNTEIDNLTIFVRAGDIESGKWKNIFVLQKEKDSSLIRLITAGEGFIATKGDDSEIVLEGAEIVSFEGDTSRRFAVENVGTVRLSVLTKRGELVQRLAKSKENPEEMGLAELAAFASKQTGIEKTEALLLWQRRIILSITPILFAILGAALVSKFNRGGRGFGVLLSLLGLITYYMVTLLGEQLARTGVIPVYVSGIFPIATSISAVIWLLRSHKVNLNDLPLYDTVQRILSGMSFARDRSGATASLRGGAILDRDIVVNILRNFAVTLGFLSAMFLLFTAFEHWKFAGTISNGVSLLVRYLGYLIPFIYIQIAPSAVMVAVVSAFVIKSRQKEVVVWASAGRSVYRAMFPALVLALGIGGANFLFQETVVPFSNRMQDGLREQLRSRNEVLRKEGNVWIAGENYYLNFARPVAAKKDKLLGNVSFFELDSEHNRIKSVITAKSAIAEGNSLVLSADATRLTWSGFGAEKNRLTDRKVALSGDPLKSEITKPSHLSAADLSQKLGTEISDAERHSYSVALYKKYAALFLPFVIVLFTGPFALSIQRTGSVGTIAAAAGLWLLLMGAITIFDQFGQSGFLNPALSVFAPLVIFSLIGLVLVSRIRT
ncbi:MAG: LptF/LptG family permease [Pyrinomonadaceae bacterium]